jgi:hypothetical protein
MLIYRCQKRFSEDNAKLPYLIHLVRIVLPIFRYEERVIFGICNYFLEFNFLNIWIWVYILLLLSRLKDFSLFTISRFSSYLYFLLKGLIETCERFLKYHLNVCFPFVKSPQCLQPKNLYKIQKFTSNMQSWGYNHTLPQPIFAFYVAD